MRLQAQAGFLLFALTTATIAEGQVTQRQQLHGKAAAKPVAATPAPVPAPEVPQAPLSLLEQPAKPAAVESEAGKLSVKADNSSLTTILHEISSKTGMTVDGAPRDQRIFGNYGPAAPREVLSALLDGLGYNVMMVGSLANGVPRQLVLSQRTGGVSPAGFRGPVQQPQNANQDDQQDDSTPDQDTPPQQPPRPEPNPSEGSQSPEQQQQQQQQQQQPGQVKTPQQLLQELQQMRQQQQQQANPQ